MLDTRVSRELCTYYRTCFWWPSMAMQMQKAISNCEQCILHEGTWAKVPMQPIIATASLELLHTDFTNIEMTMELDQPPNVVSILVFCNPLMKHIIAYVTPNQTAKTVAKFCDTSQSSEHWPSSWAIEAPILKITSSKSCVSSWACGKVRTSPYHAQTNRHIEQAHQMLMHMIWKLSSDQKADWSKHLPELVHAYNSTRLAITRYRPHYLMFRHLPCLPIDFNFSTMRGMEKCWQGDC